MSPWSRISPEPEWSQWSEVNGAWKQAGCQEVRTACGVTGTSHGFWGQRGRSDGESPETRGKILSQRHGRSQKKKKKKTRCWAWWIVEVAPETEGEEIHSMLTSQLLLFFSLQSRWLLQLQGGGGFINPVAGDKDFRGKIPAGLYSFTPQNKQPTFLPPVCHAPRPSWLL